MLSRIALSRTNPRSIPVRMRGVLSEVLVNQDSRLKHQENIWEHDETLQMNTTSSSSSAPHQMQVRVTFYTTCDPQSVLMILKTDCALEQITEKARQLFPNSDYRLFYGDVNGPIYEFTDSEQVMAKIRISTFSRTPQLFVRLEPRSTHSSTKKIKDRESKSVTLKRIEDTQEETLKSIAKLTKEFDRVSELEKIVSGLMEKEEPKKKVKKMQQSKHTATCDACLGDIIGHRFKCLECADFDLCENCERNSVHYEHAMIRLVCPRKTKIPNYILKNAPASVFPPYMRNSNNVIEIDIPIDISLPKTESPANEEAVKKMQEEARNALMASANLIKGAFQTMGKGFLDMADGAQNKLDKKVLDIPKAEEEFEKMLQKGEEVCRDFHQKYLTTLPTYDAPVQPAEASSPIPIYPELPQEFRGHQRKSKKRGVYKRAAERLYSNSFMAAMAKEETEKRTDACAADLQRKLALLTLKGAAAKVAKTSESNDPNVLDMFSEMMKSPLNPTPVSATPTAPTAPVTPPQEEASASPINIEIIGITNELVEQIVTEPVVEKMKQDETLENSSTNPIVRVLSVHSSFENISSDFEEIDGMSDEFVQPTAQQQVVESEEEVWSDPIPIVVAPIVEVIAPVEPSIPAEPTISQESSMTENMSLPSYDAQTENTFDRLLEMGFDYNVVVAAIKTNGPILENCLAALLQ